jgi:hypothetical protein
MFSFDVAKFLGCVVFVLVLSVIIGGRYKFFECSY